MQLLPFDIVVVLVFLGAAGALVYASRIGVLPKKSVPALFGALLGGLGVVVWKERQARAANRRIIELGKQLEREDARLRELERDYGATRREVEAARARYDDEVRAARERIRELEAGLDARVAANAEMTTEEIVKWATTRDAGR